MKLQVVPSDVVGIGIERRENIWVEIFGIIQLGIYVYDCDLVLVINLRLCSCDVTWTIELRGQTNFCRKPSPVQDTREMGALYYKRRRIKLIATKTHALPQFLLDQTNKWATWSRECLEQKA